MSKQNLSFTVGIPTYYGGPSLVAAVKSIRASKNVGKFRLIVSVDANPLKPAIRKQLKEFDVEIIDNKKRGGQVARLKQIISMTRTELVVLTQDDIKFPPDTLAKIITAFKENPKVTLVNATLLPLPAQSFIETIIEAGVRLTLAIGRTWNKGDNYLLASGRCQVFRTKFVKKFVIKEEVINSDAYFYFENKRHKGKFLALADAVVYNRSPQTISEHLKQSRKFQLSKQENERYLKKNLSKEYIIPRSIILNALLASLVVRPFKTVSYLLVLGYTKLFGRDMFANVTRYWDTDASTKEI